MATRTADSGILAEWWRLAGIAGIVFAVLFFVGALGLQGEPPQRTDSIDEIRKYFADDGEAYLAGDYLLGLGFVLFFLPWAVGLSQLVRRADGLSSMLSTLVVVGAVLFVVLGGVGSIFFGTLAINASADPAIAIDDASVRTLMEMSQYSFVGFALTGALFLAPASFAIWRTGVLWRWLAIIGGIAAALLIIGSAWTIDGDEDGAIASLAFVGFIVTMIFLLISSVGMIMRRTPPETA